MAVYYINSYDITDMEAFSKYPPLVLALLPKYGGEVIVSDLNAISIEGQARQMNAIVRFPSEEDALNCYNSDEYATIKKIRQNSTANCTMLLAKEYVAP
jgi:uncharacterized protein (DUF1330 family)